ncbi:matrix metalloproteinase-17b [Periophthalmus magnuspinnatus]|uniref:matrix metalloproteinase-17b n=1 Tax=Periophthalmus magnuspinnatus TaxID=409849 RepID=UPI0024371ADB|nr:matrix metalloproteinase-17b [Periophthalmus magnuspinnatus]
MWVLLLCLGEAWLTSAATITTATPAASPQSPPTEDHSTQLVDWLLKYGYLPPPDPSTGQLQAWTAVTSAVRSMQRFAGLNDTGVLDEETMALMKTPRCSLPDQEQPSGGPPNQEQNLRRRRAVSTWSRRNINWRLQSYPPSSALPRDTVRSLVYYALQVWAQPTPLDFHEVGSPGDTDLQIDFHQGYHGDDYPFDGVGGAVGHAFFPSDPQRAGGIHLDAQEEWAFRQTAAEGTDLFTVLLHELGHALGLSHSSSRHSVMRPYYQGPAGDPLHYRLGPQDLESITLLYGKRQQLKTTDAPRLDLDLQLRHRPHPRRPHPHPHLHHRAAIDRCNTTFDAVARIRGETFFFKDLSMWRVSSSGLVSSRGAAVRRLWRSLPLDLRLRAVLERASDHSIVFISGSQVWLFRDLSLQEGYPAPLSSLRMGPRVEERVEEESGERQGLLWDVEEGPIWGDTEAATTGPEADVWTHLLKEGVSGITTDARGAVYMFTGSFYWKFPFPGSAPEDGYPRSIAADWLDCPNSGLVPTGGRQELRESKGEDKGHKELGERKDRGDKELGGRQHTGAHVWTHCTCQSGAKGSTTETIFLILTFLSMFVIEL